jgi:uncharacterized protein YukE
MHSMLQMAAEDVAVLDFQAAAEILGLFPGPLRMAISQTDTDPGAIEDIAAAVARPKIELEEGYRDLNSAVAILLEAWKGERHDNWAKHASAVLDYYQPNGVRRKPGVLKWVDKTAKAARSLTKRLDKATGAVGKHLIGRAAAVHPSSLAVLAGTATPEDVALVTQAVNDVATSVAEFQDRVGQLRADYLIKPELAAPLPFNDSFDRADPAKELHIEDDDFDRGLEKLESSMILAAVARQKFVESMSITSTYGRSPFGNGPAGAELTETWAQTVSSRAEESTVLNDRTRDLKESAERAQKEFHRVDRQAAEKLSRLLEDLGSSGSSSDSSSDSPSGN